MSGQITSIYRYPVKGLSPEALTGIRLTAGEGVPDDRRFALARAETQFDPEHPEWLPKTKFVMLARDERLAQLRTRFEGKDTRLAIEHEGSLRLNACLDQPEERELVETFFADFLGDALSGPPKLVTAPGHTFTDASRKPNSTTYKYVSLVNLASIRALEKVVGGPIDPIRFRSNLYFDGPQAWSELGWVGSELVIGGARLRVVSPTTRCAATTVNPDTAERDLNIPKSLQTNFWHTYMGIYAEVVSPGGIEQEDAILPVI